VLGEFGENDRKARGAYQAFMRAEVGRSATSPLAQAFRGVILGSHDFVSKLRRLLAKHKADAGLRELRARQPRPSLDEIVQAVCEVTKTNALQWVRGRRCDDASRAIAAYVARCRHGYPSVAVAARLGYAAPACVSYAARRVASARGRHAATIQRILTRLATER
jgi:hypothetical protein